MLAGRGTMATIVTIVTNYCILSKWIASQIVISLSSLIYCLLSHSIDFLSFPLSISVMYYLLYYCITSTGNITPLGQDMSTLPLEPRVSRMLLAAANPYLHCEKEIAAVAGVLSAEDIWHSPNPRTASPTLVRAAEAAHASMRSPLGDHLTCLRVFERFEEACHQTTGGSGGSTGSKMTIVEWCEKHFLRYRALRNAKNIRDQVTDTHSN